MFSKGKSDPVQTYSGALHKEIPNDKPNTAPSSISADMKVIGDMQSVGDIQIKGSVEGDIKSRTVTIDEKARISGSVSADTANILGCITGKINASAVRVAKTANIQGDIHYQTLSIEEGAVIDGHISRWKQDGKSAAAEKPQTGEANVSSLKPATEKPLDATPDVSRIKPSPGGNASIT